MNLIIIICSIAVMLYVIAESYTIITGWIAEWQLKREEKKRYNNELYAFKVKKILLTAFSYGKEMGLSPKKATQMAFKYTHDVENANMVDIKYDLIRSVQYDGNRAKTSC